MARHVRVTLGGRDFVVHIDKDGARINDAEGVWTTTRRPDGRVTVRHDAGSVIVSVARTGASTWVGTDGFVADATVETGRTGARASASSDDALRPPMSATVVRVNTSEGATVAEGDVLVVLEAMKMELPIRAPRAGVVKTLHCREGELVQPATVLVDLE